MSGGNGKYRTSDLTWRCWTKMSTVDDERSLPRAGELAMTVNAA